MAPRTADSLLDHIGGPAGSLPPFLYPLSVGDDPPWLADLRAGAFRAYQAHGLPTRKREAWKYTDLSFLADTAFMPCLPVAVSQKDLDRAPLLAVSVPRIVLVNGVLDPALSRLDLLPAGIRLHPIKAPFDGLSPVLDRDQVLDDLPSRPMAALNLALFQHGLVIEVEEGTCVEDPIHLVSLTASGPDAPAFAVPRVGVWLQPGSCAHVLESLTGIGPHPTFTNGVLDVVLEDGARLTHTRLVRDPAQASRIETTLADLAANARYDTLTAVLGGRLLRNEVCVRLGGAGAHADVRGLYGAGDGAHVDNTILMDHAHPGATSSQLFKGVVDGTGRAVFQGKVLVRRGASGTDARQLHKALMLSRKAEVDIKPELFIYDNDVACSHGATVGDLDEDALFYLQSRGLDLDQARALLVDAFLDDMLDTVAPDTVRTALAQALGAWRATPAFSPLPETRSP